MWCARGLFHLVHAGGYVYRGSKFADILGGHYIFADHSSGWVQDLYFADNSRAR